MQLQRTLRFLALAAVILLSCARVPAEAAFAPPYDPDFPPEKKEEPVALEAAPEPEPAGLPPLLAPATGSFLLMDRPEKGRILEQPVETPLPTAPAPGEFEEFQEKLKTFEFSPEKWRTMRSHVEKGIVPSDGGLVEYVSEETVEVSTFTAPKPPPPEVELPTYGTSLSITGRKIIGFTFSEQRFLNDQAKTGRRATTNLIEINQQLQLRMQGKVGPKITVNVDYDDTKLNHQDISVVYTGDPNEVVQNVSFGDIDLSLPATEFVSYNKQLFGIRADIKYQGLKASFIGSRTKGTTKTKQFFGNTQFVATDILDTAYVRRKNYDITFGLQSRLPIQSGSEKVFLARQAPGLVNVNDVAITADDLAVNASSFTGNFSQLNPGQDYTIDYVKGIISFRNPLQPEYVAAVEFIDASGNNIAIESSSGTFATGGSGRRKLIKTASDVPISTTTEVGYNRELKTFYSIGQTQIVRDNGRGNFVLKVLDQQRNEVGTILNPPQKYPDTILVDFENGIFQLQQPFAVIGDTSLPDREIYAFTPISKRILHVEYNFRFKTFFLEPNLVPQSEVVLLDNIKLNRNVDYFIDYEAGFVTFFNENRITAQSEIDISYEVAPFAGISEDSLLGTRVSYNFNNKFAVGSTLLYQTGAKSPTVPTITELSKSLMVYDFDSKLTDIRLGRKLKITSLAGEIAQSHQNLNLNPYALIDNMEGIKQEDSAGTLAQQWFIASNPGGARSDPTKITWNSEDVKVLDINPRSQASSQETQKVLDVNYDFTNSLSTEVSIVFPFSAAGNDFSQKSILEVVMLGDLSNNEINFRLGGINEDADSNGALGSEDVNVDGILQPAEDVGWTYIYSPDPSKNTKFGAGNGRIDSEDLNNNSRLDSDDGNGNNFGYGTDLTSLNAGNKQLFNITDGSTHTFINFGGGKNWKTFQIPLNISTATVGRWTNIKQVRVSLRRRAGGTDTGTVKIARLAVVGNTWQLGQAVDPSNNNPPVGTESLTVTPVNNVDNPTYTPIFNAGGDASQVFNDLYGSLANLQKQSNTKNLSEQALQFDFSGMSTSAVVTTKRLFSRAVDISQHKYFNFLVFGNADSSHLNTTDHVFFLRVGNETNFFEVQVPLNFAGWKKIRVHQSDLNGDSIADVWESATPGTVVVSSGSPSLQQVSSIVAGIRSVGFTPGPSCASGPGTTCGRAYLNEIHLAEPVTRVGNARKVEANFEVPGWSTFGGKYREVDRNFQTPTSVVSNQDNRQDSGYLNFTRLSFFPLTFNLARAITQTPNTVQTGNLSNIVNILQQGKVTAWTGSAQGNFSYGVYPRLNLSHTRNRTEYDLLTRLDDRKSYNGTLQYGIPLNSRFIPKTLDANYTFTRFDVSFQSLAARKLPGNFNTDEYTNTLGTRLTFVPWTGSSFNPSYSLSRVTERRSDFTGDFEKNMNYPKSQIQNAGFSSNYRLASWLNPQANYSVDILENNVLNISTFIVSGSTHVFDVGDIKTVNRNANGSLSLPIAIGEIIPRMRLFKSMNIISGYQIQDGDVWNNLEKELNTQTAFWIRTPLRPTGPAALRASRTLRDTFNSTQRWSPLEAYTIAGRLAPLKTFSLSNNYVRSIERSDVTGTQSKTISTTFPDAVANISQLERLWYAERWMSSTQMNFKFSAHKTENIGQTINNDHAFGTDLRSVVLKRFDSLVSYNNRSSKTRDLRVEANTQQASHQDATVQVTFDLKKFRFTPKTDYVHDTAALGTGVKTQDLTVITPSLLMRADLALPRGLLIPGSVKPILFSNRIIWTTTLSLSNRSSPVTIADNSRLFSFNTSGDYEIAKNLRMTLNGSMSRLWHRFLKEEDFVSYQFGTNLTFQF